MRRSALCVAAIALALVGCPRDHGSETMPVAQEMDAASDAKKSTFAGKIPAFIDALGGKPQVTSATAGKYAGSSSMNRWQLMTMEIVVSEGARGCATLTLADDGGADGCFASRWSRTRSESHYSSKSGKDESSTEKRRTLVGARGRWTMGADGWLEVRFDATMRDACPPPSPLPPENSYGAFQLRCLRVEASESIPTPLLVCAPGDVTWPVEDLLVPLARDAPKDWLVLADASAGVSVVADYGRSQGMSDPGAEGAPKITFEKSPVVLTVGAWTKD